jgi:hypothetical protein
MFATSKVVKPKLGKRNGMTAPGFLATWVLVVVVLSLTGCGPTVRSAASDVPRIAVPITVDRLLDSLEDPRVRTRIARIMATPEMQQAVEEFGAAVARGAVENASTEEARARLAELSTRVADAFTQALADGLSPDHALGRALSGSATEATHDSLRAAAEEIPASVAPAVRQALVTELGTPELRKAIADTTADVTRETLIKSRDVIGEMQSQPHPRGLIERIDRLLTFGWLLGIGVAAGASVLFIRAMTAQRRIEATRLDGASELADRAAAASQGKPWSDELQALLRDQVQRAHEFSRARGRSGGGWWPSSSRSTGGRPT